MGITEDRIQRNLLAFMAERGVKAPDLSFLSGIPIGTLQKYMNGQRVPKSVPLAQLAEALGRPAGDFFLEHPGPGKAYRRPAFGLRILDEEVSPDLLKRAQTAIDELNREHAAREVQERSKVYVTDMDVDLPGEVDMRRLNVADSVKPVAGSGAARDAAEAPTQPRQRARGQNQKR